MMKQECIIYRTLKGTSRRQTGRVKAKPKLLLGVKKKTPSDYCYGKIEKERGSDCSSSCGAVAARGQ